MEQINTVIERTLSGFIVSKARYYQVETGSIEEREGNRFNVFGHRLDDIVRIKKVYKTRVMGGEALSSSFKTKRQAAMWAKQHGMIIVSDKPHSIVKES